jgi:hypothetical protein
LVLFVFHPRHLRHLRMIEGDQKTFDLRAPTA